MPALRITHKVTRIDVDEHQVWRCVDCYRTWLVGFRWQDEYNAGLCPARYDMMSWRSHYGHEEYF